MGSRAVVELGVAAVLGIAAGSLVASCASEDSPAAPSGVDAREQDAAQVVANVAPAVAPAADPPATRDRPPPPPRGVRSASRPQFPDVTLTTHTGEQVQFFKDLIEGKTVVINFMYATCTGT